MGRRKIEIKFIENTTKRKATYSKRRSGILKKARELSILCDVHVCLVMFSNTGKLAEYISSSITMKDIFDRYEKKTNIDLSASEYEIDNKDLLKSLQREFRKQEEINSILREDIR
ncbi:floral homeotic protein PMADS 1-like [Papaver somniferum]|uniref:floral homeotic protein PMADS 1-like n=1 Tax=Papaver somniferum TaxID=3469 RepID=UPI000E6FE10C|nr:floral homeotic protein PMADS 1-like [Papaver somniferum]